MAVAQVDADGVSVVYHDSAVAVPGARPLVLVHGAGGSTEKHFGHLFPMMAARTRVVSVDLASPPREEQLTLTTLTRQVRAATDEALGAGTPFDLLGYSLGAVVALELAAQLGDRVEHLVLAAGWMTTDPQQKLRNEVWRMLHDTDPVALRRYAAYCNLSGRFLRQLPPGMLDAVVTLMPSDDFTRRQMELLGGIDLSERTGAITARTLIVSCREDFAVPEHHQLELLGAIDDARLTYVSSGHAVVLERPAELQHVTDVFLRDPGRHPAGSIIDESRP